MFQDKLGYPDKADQEAQPGAGWTPTELTDILQAHSVLARDIWLNGVGFRDVQRALKKGFSFIQLPNWQREKALFVRRG